jgi:cell division protein FtsQ
MPRRTKQRRPLAPSRAAYRMQRLWLTPSFRRFLRIGLPLALVATAGGSWLSDVDHRNHLRREIAQIKHVWRTHPMFMVSELRLSGVSTAHETAILAALGLSFPVSRYDLDTDAISSRLEQIGPVAEATVELTSDGILEVRVRERIPAALYRENADLIVIDIDGNRIQSVTNRRDHKDLPLLTGPGARGAVSQAILLDEIAEPLDHRMRGLVRIGDRRWNLVLDRDQQILLPEANPAEVLRDALGMITQHDLLTRDISAVDLRIKDHPTIRLNDAAAQMMLAARDDGDKQ